MEQQNSRVTEEPDPAAPLLPEARTDRRFTRKAGSAES
jgi:hypothetical protein